MMPARRLMIMATSIKNYLEMKGEMKDGADAMLNIVFSENSTQHEIEMALYTLEEALFPNETQK